MEIGRRGSTWRSAAEPGAGGSVWSCACGLANPPGSRIRQRVTSKLSAELADVVSGLPTRAALAVVMVDVEVLVTPARTARHGVAGLQLGATDGGLGLGLAAAARQPPVSAASLGLGAADGQRGLAAARLSRACETADGSGGVTVQHLAGGTAE